MIRESNPALGNKCIDRNDRNPGWVCNILRCSYAAHISSLASHARGQPNPRVKVRTSFRLTKDCQCDQSHQLRGAGLAHWSARVSPPFTCPTRETSAGALQAAAAARTQSQNSARNWRRYSLRRPSTAQQVCGTAKINMHRWLPHFDNFISLHSATKISSDLTTMLDTTIWHVHAMFVPFLVTISV